MSSYWKNKKILITGGQGFIGKALTKKLLALGTNIYVLNNKKATDPPFANINLILGDVSETDFIFRIFNKYRFNFCFHLAAQSNVDMGSQDPISTFDTNIKGTWNILEASRINKLEGIVIASTSHVYGKNKLPFLEEYFPRPSRPYETSKACADMIAQTYASFYNLPVAIARFVNTYGPGDTNARIIPRTIKLLLENKSPEIFIDKTTRDYLYVDDAVNAYVVLAEKIRILKKKYNNLIFNFGTSKHYSNATVIKQIVKLWNNSPQIKPILCTKKRQHEISRQFVAVKKAQKLLGWKPKYSLNTGLKETINWYKSTHYPLSE